MAMIIVAGAIGGYWLGQRALKRHLINGVTGVIALLILMSFFFTSFGGWCAYMRNCATGSQLVLSWTVLFFSAWLGLFVASLIEAVANLRPAPSSMQFSSLRDKYEIIYDNGQAVKATRPQADLLEVSPAPKAPARSAKVIELPFGK